MEYRVSAERCIESRRPPTPANFFNNRFYFYFERWRRSREIRPDAFFPVISPQLKQTPVGRLLNAQSRSYTNPN
jgi:hypothetical protein